MVFCNFPANEKCAILSIFCKFFPSPSSPSRNFLPKTVKKLSIYVGTALLALRFKKWLKLRLKCDIPKGFWVFKITDFCKPETSYTGVLIE